MTARLGALERARARQRGENVKPPTPGFYVAAAELLGFKPASIVDICRLSKDLGEPTLAKLAGTSLDTGINLRFLCKLDQATRGYLIESAISGGEVSAHRTFLERASPPKKRGRPRKHPPPAPTTPAAPPDLQLLESWKHASSYERRMFVRNVRDELTAPADPRRGCPRSCADPFDRRKGAGGFDAKCNALHRLASSANSSAKKRSRFKSPASTGL